MSTLLQTWEVFFEKSGKNDSWAISKSYAETNSDCAYWSKQSGSYSLTFFSHTIKNYIIPRVIFLKKQLPTFLNTYIFLSIIFYIIFENLGP